MCRQFTHRAPCSQGSAPQTRPSTSVLSTPSTLCTELGTGRLWQMLNSLVSLSISSHPPLYHILSLLLASSTVYNSIKDCKPSKMKRWGNRSLRGQSHRQLRAGGKVRACHECAKMLSPQHCRGWSPMEACRAHVILAQGTAEISVSLKGNMQPLKIQCYFLIFFIFCKHRLREL